MSYKQNVIVADGKQGDLKIDTDPGFLLAMKLSLLQCHSSGLCERTHFEVHFILVLRIKSYTEIMKFFYTGLKNLQS